MARDGDEPVSPGADPWTEPVGAGEEEMVPDPISDPGLEGGVDAPNESTEEPDPGP